MSRFLVTGGTGFLGSHLVRFLTGRGDEVVASGREHDLRDASLARALFGGCGPVDYLVHLADVQGNARWSVEHCAEQFMSNAAMTLNVLDAWHRLQPQARFVGVSSLWAYPEAVVDARESDYWSGPMHGPTEHYGINKKLLGVGLGAHKRQHGMRGTALVLGSVYGPGDCTDHVIPSLLRRMGENPSRLEVWGDGSESRDFIYVDDQIQGIVRHLDHDGDLLNIGSGRHHTIREVVATLVSLTGYRGEVVFTATAAAGSANRHINVDLARRATGWPDTIRPHTLEEGLSKTVAAFKGQ